MNPITLTRRTYASAHEHVKVVIDAYQHHLKRDPTLVELLFVLSVYQRPRIDIREVVSDLTDQRSPLSGGPPIDVVTRSPKALDVYGANYRTPGLHYSQAPPVDEEG